MWLGNTTLRKQYSALYNIVRYKGDTIATVMAFSPLNVTFRRDLSGPRIVAWNSLLRHLAPMQLTDEFGWNLHDSGSFSVDSMYKAQIHPKIPDDFFDN
jgi:hypothetical protein